MGRTSLLMVIGFNVVFMMMGFSISQYASDAYLKYSGYYQIEQAQYTSQSASNIALNGIYMTNLLTPGAIWNAPTGTITLPNGGTYSVVIDSTIFATKDTMQMRINATYQGITSQTVVDFARASFTTYAMFNVNENGIYWISGDTCKGALHTQDYLYVSGNPYFKGAVTTGKGLKKQNTSDNPTFAGGYHTGVNQPLPSDNTAVKALGRLTGTNGGKDWVHTTGTYPTPGIVALDFKQDGKICVTVTPQTGTTTTGWPPTTVPVYGTPVTTMYNNITALTPNGVLLVEDMPVHVKGVVKGNVTIGCVDNPVGSGNSKVYLDSSIAYDVNPKLPNGDSNPACTSTLGIVSDNDVIITDNTNNSHDVTIDASIFSLNGGFTAENYNTTRDVDGQLYLVGAIQAKDRKGVGTFSGSGTLASGFHKNYDYDQRLQDNPPAGYPQTTNFQVKNWYEGITKYPDIFNTFMGAK